MGSSSLDCDRRHSGAVRGTRKVGGRGNAQGVGSKRRTTAPGERKAAPPAGDSSKPQPFTHVPIKLDFYFVDT